MGMVLAVAPVVSIVGNPAAAALADRLDKHKLWVVNICVVFWLIFVVMGEGERKEVLLFSIGLLTFL